MPNPFTLLIGEKFEVLALGKTEKRYGVFAVKHIKIILFVKFSQRHNRLL